jgi:glutamate/tyrosine decarboxylase-like PLP-dependent enzyme
MTGDFDEADIFRDAASRGASYLRGIPEHRVSPSPGAIAALARLGGPLPSDGEPPADVVALLDEVGSPGTVLNGGGRYFGFVTGAALPAARAANVLAAAWDQNAGLRVMSPVAAMLEEIALGWLVDLLDLPKDCGGAFVTGATMANFTCLAAARHALLARAGWNVEADGLFGAPPLTVVVGEEVHVSALKALALLGLGWNRVVKVPTDGQGRMRADRLPPLDATTILCTQAGNVNTGAFDPFDALCAEAHQAGAWVHVDGAFGIWALVSPRHKGQAAGVTRADSWATDAHKWLNVPYDCGLAFVRDASALLNAMTMQPAAYLQRAEGREPMLWTPEASRRARGIEVWAALRQLGRGGLADLVARCCRHARRFADGLTRAGYAVLNDVRLNQVLVAFRSDAHTRAVIEGIQRDGTCWCGGTTWKGRAAMRISVSSWATTEADVEKSLEAIVRVAQGAQG